MKDGKKLLTEIANLSPVPVFVRAHSLLVTGDGKAALKGGVRGERDVNTLAAKNRQSAMVMVWNYHDDNSMGPESPVEVKLKGIPAAKVFVQHYRIDQQFSNSYEV